MKDLSNENIIHVKKNDIEYLQFKKLLEYENIVHCYTLKTGELNFKKANGQTYVENNYKRICDVLGMDYKDIIRPDQNHTNKVVVIEEKTDRRPDIFSDNFINIDGAITNKKDILIYHTHTCESYTPSEQYQYQQTGNFRTTDLNFSVARVGAELTNCLTSYGFKVTHDKTYHDYPAYSGSYTRSASTVGNVLKTSPSDIIIDLHRDAIGSKSDYDPSVKIGDDVAAQLMFVIGTNGGGLYHPNWQSNLKFAIEVQQKANELYPGLFKPMIVRKSRYNQHLGSAACIIEVGATGNTMEQCLNSMKYLAKVIDEYKK